MRDGFYQEVSMIQDKEMNAFVMFVVSYFPDKFWYMPASSTGKYHPETSLGNGGLYRHTKQVFWTALTILNSQMFENVNRDIVLAACILHDGWKYGNKHNHTLRNHGVVAVAEIKALIERTNFFRGTPAWYQHLLDCVQAHNGKFNKEWTDEFTLEMKIVHIADYLASRPFLEFKEAKCPINQPLPT